MKLQKVIDAIAKHADLNERRAQWQKKVTAMAAPYFLTIQNENPFGTLIEHRCTTSLGLTMLSLENLDHKIPLVHADAAMYEAKRT